MRRRTFLVIGGVAAVVVAAIVLVWFQPQKLWIDERVNEDAPTAEPRSTAATDTPDTPPEEPDEVARDMFASLDHTTRGTVRVLRLGDDERVVRLEDFETDNGPDLFVYLSTNAP